MLVIGIAGATLAAHERAWLQHPSVGGVILFARNIHDRDQVVALNAALREAAGKPLLLCVDQEGGRVARLREGFSALPPLAGFDALYRVDPDGALALAHQHAWLIAREVRAAGFDLSYTPVVDLGRGNRAIGDRAFSADPAVVAAFAEAYVGGLHAGGMAATLKHFPGHGSVLEDTHFEHAIDPRDLATLRAEDLVPFAAGIRAGAEAVMMAHVTYPAVAPEAAGYARPWIELLRGELGFTGVVFSDDIGMAAAHGAGGVAGRIHAHYDAGCDSVLVCHPELVEASLAAMEQRADLRPDALHALIDRAPAGFDALAAEPAYAAARAALDGRALALG